MTAHSLARRHGCPHQSAPSQNLDATFATSPNLHGLDNKQMHENIDKIDSALRRIWLWLGGVLLPSAGAIVYTMAHLT